MLIPTTYLTALLLLIFSAFCWGSWANTQKLTGKWRFELYYYDFTWGLAIAAVVAAFTAGSLDPKELTFQDTLLLAGYRKMLWGVAAGVVFNFANILLVAAISVAGMAVAFPMVVGLAVIVSVLWSYSLGLQASPLLLFGGILLVLVAVFIAGTSYSMLIEERRAAAQKALTPDPRGRKPPRGKGAAGGILLAVFSGLFMGAFYPLLEESRIGEDGTGPYGVIVLFALGVFLSTTIFVPFFLNFPVNGQPLAVTQYFKGTKKQHFLGFLGGVVWCAGGVASVVAFSSPPSLQVGSSVTYALGQTAAMVIAALWGLLAWNESNGSTYRVKMTLAATLVLFLIGMGLMAISPVHG
jgi:glucose uptake protein